MATTERDEVLGGATMGRRTIRVVLRVPGFADVETVDVGQHGRATRTPILRLNEAAVTKLARAFRDARRRLAAEGNDDG